MCTDMKSVCTDFIDWLMFSASGHLFVFNVHVHQFLKISVNRCTDFLSTNYTSSW